MMDHLVDLADFNEPPWPGWRWLVLLALVLQLCLSAQAALGADTEQLRPPRVRPGRPQITRLLPKRGSDHV